MHLWGPFRCELCVDPMTLMNGKESTQLVRSSGASGYILNTKSLSESTLHHCTLGAVGRRLLVADLNAIIATGFDLLRGSEHVKASDGRKPTLSND